VSRDAEVSTDSILLPLTLRSGILRNTACSVKAGSMSRSSRHDATLSRSRIVGGVVCGAILCEENSDSRPSEDQSLGMLADLFRGSYKGCRANWKDNTRQSGSEHDKSVKGK